MIQDPAASLVVEHVSPNADSLIADLCAAPGGKTERLCRDALAGGKRVFTLESSDNAHLVALGAAPLAADDPAACLDDGVGSPASR